VKDNRNKTKEHLRRSRKLKRPNPNSLPLSVAGAVVVALGIGAGLFWLMYELFYTPEQTNLYDVTRTVIAALAALTVGGAAVIQYRKHKIAEIDLADTHDAKMSERLSMAIEHLAADKLHIRIGALYELRRLAEDSPRDRASIQEIVTQFLNGKRDEIEELSRAHADNVPRYKNGRIVFLKLPSLPSDITVALNMLFFLHKNYRDDYKEDCEIMWDCLDARYLNLRALPFVNASLWEARFDGASLYEAHFDDANILEAHFDDANLVGAHFDGALLDEAHFDGANLKEAHFDSEYFEGTHFNGAFLGDAHFDGAEFWETHFDGADLYKAHFDGAEFWDTHFDSASLYEAHFDDAEFWDTRFDGAILLDAHFDDANLIGAHFDGANICRTSFTRASYLKPEQLINVKYDKFTAFPVGFRPPALAKRVD
jgi:uncharacterized protein YjbI with pentapeptide repeats